MTTQPETYTTVVDLIACLRAAADWLDANKNQAPEAQLVYTGSGVDGSTTALLQFMCRDRDQLAEVTRWFGTADKVGAGDYLRVRRPFGPFHIEAWATRDAVCEKVQVGTTVVELPVAEGPEADRVRKLEDQLAKARAEVPTAPFEQPVYEWSCEPILRPATRDENLAGVAAARAALASADQS